MGIVANLLVEEEKTINKCCYDLRQDSSGEVVSNSNVLTELVKQSVAIVSRKRKVVS